LGAEARELKEVENLEAKIEEAERKALDNLARYKFMNFGYWASIWVHLNKLAGGKRPNPFRDLVKLAQRIRVKGNVEGIPARR